MRKAAESGGSLRPEGLYRRIYCRMWSDQRFTGLSRDAQLLWVFMLTGPHTSKIPGLFRLGKSTAAEEMRMELDEFVQTWSEIESAGMARADWAARMVFIPRAVVYNPPESPSVVISWGRAFRDIPECDLRNVARTHLAHFICQLGKGFAEAFKTAFDDEPNRLFMDRDQSMTNPPKAGRAPSMSGSAKGPKKPAVESARNGYQQGVGQGDSQGGLQGGLQGANQGQSSAQTAGGADASHGEGVTRDPVDGDDAETSKNQRFGVDTGNGYPQGVGQGDRQGDGHTPPHKHKQEHLGKPSPKGDMTDLLTQDPPFKLPAAQSLDGSAPTLETLGPIPCPHTQIIDLYHRMLPRLPRVLPSRWRGSDSETHLTARWREGLEAGKRGVGIEEFGFATREQGLEALEHFFGLVAASRFLHGENDKNWTADLRWLLRPTNFNKVLEGRYTAGSDKASGAGKVSRLGVQPGDSYNRFDHFPAAPGGGPEDRRVLRFDGGLYLLGEDCVLLDAIDADLVQRTLAELEPYGQVVQVGIDRLPERVAKMRTDRQRGWLQSPPIPLRPEELPDFPPVVAAARAANDRSVTAF
ncbi:MULTISPECIES: hypothetical protein [Ralstonia]|jgi:hypothetical protein|uniref:hypothetical protein n=1 Tax=Ralstonia TaxID=48736 RepID=UPI0005D7AD12|nr:MULTISPECIES: hypothetical protein [Ralstonia]NOZ17939.1 hypothetical protein [Betaproteobacteria bacterium]AJW47572.1 hypothetical protein TK49_22825 [Ralstonia mannitolilytica]MBA9871395.1 hypothetical protein [Ralstonia insidiosa]MBA9954640.1 hypothetical protein [Ralstonia insidiosa]MBA9971152.1 hypothetical protein [Ralstonia insidiosa]